MAISQERMNWNSSDPLTKRTSDLPTVFSLILCLVFFIACEEDPDAEKLPPITLEGKNTFGCLVNGQVWLPKGTLGQPGIVADIANDRWVWVGADNNDSNTGITLNLSDIHPIQSGTRYILQNDTTFYSEYNMRIGDFVCFHKYNHVLSGSVTLSKLDAGKGIISGTFEFTMFNPDCGDTLRITEGRFDIGNLIH